MLASVYNSAVFPTPHHGKHVRTRHEAHAEVAALISRNLVQIPKPVEVVFIATDGDLGYTAQY
jgi:hypothetical protein